MSSGRSSSPEEKFVEIPYVVEHNYDGWRLDLYLREKIARLSRSRIQRIIQNSLISDRKLKPATVVRTGLSFRLRRRLEEEPETPTHIREIYLDDDLLVLDKPAGLPIHPTARYHNGTLVTLVRSRYQFQAHPVHRLDRETSGLIVMGRTTDACRTLMLSFQRGEVEKDYLAICEGSPPEDQFVVDAPIAEGTDVIRIAVRIDREVGRPSRTRFSVLRRFERDGEPFALLRCHPQTGRQHQIRVHLREAGFPIVGDKIYGPDQSYFDRFSRHCLEPEAWERLRLPRHALHAASITFTHPSRRERMTLDAPLPEDLAGFLPQVIASGSSDTGR
ncbi:MAG: RluA family pseudouridine synthase [Myxococcaceae bacterium]